MIPTLMMMAAVMLFFLALRMSAFYSGCETGFYRISPMQLGIRAQQGDSRARWLHWFTLHPERFVATTLVGNNTANYLITLSLGLGIASLVENSSGAGELFVTLLMTPVVFVLGELVPKSLFYRAPLSLLKQGTPWFVASYVLFYPLTYPLVQLSRLTARIRPSRAQPVELMLSRTRLVGVLEAGQQEGLLSAQQGTLTENVLRLAREPASTLLILASTIQGASESDDRETLLRVAERLQTPRLLLHAAGRPRHWIGCLRVADLLKPGTAPRNVMRELPVFEADSPKLVVLSELVRTGAPFAALSDGDVIQGVVSRRTLLAQLQRTGPRANPG